MDKINFQNKKLPALNATNLNQLQENIENAIKTNIITGQECPTNEYHNSQRVYVKEIDFGTLPNATTKSISIGLTNYNFIKYEASFSSSFTKIMLPITSPTDANQSVYAAIQGANFVVKTNADYSQYTGFVRIYYTKS